MSRREPTSVELRRRRRRVNVLFALLLLAGAGVGAYAVSVLLPAHAQWEYENRREYRDIPAFEAPCSLEVDIWYQGEAPQGIRIDNGGIGLNRIQVSDDTDEKLLSVWCDLSAKETDGADPDGWQLSLVPMDNLELTYQVRTEPSYEHALADVRFIRDPDGRRWIAVSAGYGHLRDDSTLRTLAHLDGNQYQPTVMDWSFDGSEGSVRMCLDGIIEERSIDDKKAGQCAVSVLCGGTDRNGEPININERVTFRLADWPEYDEDAWDEISGFPDGTEDYLDRLNPRRVQEREAAEKEEDGGDAAETPQEGG